MVTKVQVKKIKDKKVLILLNQLAKKITKNKTKIKHETVQAQVKRNTLTKIEPQPSSSPTFRRGSVWGSRYLGIATTVFQAFPFPDQSKTFKQFSNLLRNLLLISNTIFDSVTIFQDFWLKNCEPNISKSWAIWNFHVFGQECQHFQ